MYLCICIQITILLGDIFTNAFIPNQYITFLCSFPFYGIFSNINETNAKCQSVSLLKCFIALLFFINYICVY